MLYKREKYLSKLRPFYRTDMIKVITGIRRCGKSCIMQLIREELLASGVPEKDILYLDLDKRVNKSIKTPALLESKIDSLITDGDFKYLFIDEVQNVQDFEETVNGFNTDGNISIFLTGSNSYLLSGEIATKLTGRYLEFEIFTLDFSEYMEMKRHLGLSVNGDINAEFNEYIINGGFPKALEFQDIEARRFYTRSVIEEIFRKDIQANVKIRNRSVFERVQNYVVNNFGATFSIKNLFDYFNKTEKTPVKKETIRRYIKILTDAKIIYPCPRFDCKSRKSLSGEQKYYLADLSIYFMTVTDNRISYGPALENLIYLYLRNSGYSVSVGRIGKLECDFIARRANDYRYIQVAMTIAEQQTEEREYRPFYQVRDNYPKYLLTLDPLLQERDGVEHKNIVQVLSQNIQL
ncbi:MAG: ATP-binding protein [Oscillospiraceae bacterium]|nr:ATP-binding protein [Oscillospiraceae bacterium]